MILSILGEFCFTRPKLVLAGIACTLLLCLGAAYQNLNLDTDWLVLFSPKHPEIQTLTDWRQSLPGSKDIGIIISGGDLQDRQAGALHLGSALAAEKEHLTAPLYSLPSTLFLESGLFYLPTEVLAQLESDVEALVSAGWSLDPSESIDLQALVSGLLQTPNGEDLVWRLMDLGLATTDPNGGVDSSSFLGDAEPEHQLLRNYFHQIQSGDEQAFLSLDDGRTLLILVRAKLESTSLEDSEPAVTAVREILEEVRPKHPAISFALTGEPVLVVDERATISQDSLRGTLCSLLLILLIFRYGFCEMVRPACALSTLLVGLVWTVGAVSATIGHLNFITVTYVPIIIGIGIDFAIHLSFRYFEVRETEPGPAAIRKTMSTAGWDTTFGAVVTCSVFAVMMIVGFRGVAELGMIAFLGVLLCQLSACTFLPALLGLLDGYNFQLSDRGRRDLRGLQPAVRAWTVPLLSFFGVLAAVGIVGFTWVRFDIHLLKMQSQKLESVRTELSLVESGRSSVLTLLVPADSLQESQLLEEQLRALPSVAQVIAVSTFLPKDEMAKREHVRTIIEAQDELSNLIGRLEKQQRFDARTALRLIERLEQTPSEKLLSTAGLLRNRVDQRGPGPVLDAFEEIRLENLEEAKKLLPLLRLQSAVSLKVDDLPPELTSRLITSDGRFVLRVFPKLDIWQSENLHRFLDEVKSVKPEVSGEPILIALFERLVIQTHWWGIFWSVLGLGFVQMAIFRDVRWAALATAPSVLSLFVVLALMGLLGWSFNPANFVAIPMLLGIGSVFGLHSVLRMQELGHDEVLCCSTGPAILLSAATSAAGFISLGLAEHQGIASLGYLVTLGICVNTLFSVCLLPYIVRAYPNRFRFFRCPNRAGTDLESPKAPS